MTKQGKLSENSERCVIFLELGRWKPVAKKGKVSKIEYGNVDFEKVIIETVTSTQR